MSDTELKLLAVIPTGEPSSAWVVMMVTPVVKVPSAVRKAWGSKPMFGVAMTDLMGWDFRDPSIGRRPCVHIVLTD
ncbi:hypothetical protein D3C79_949550 [compost metagenome]